MEVSGRHEVDAAAQGGRTAAGLNGFASGADKLKKFDVKAQVDRHSDYHTNVELV